MKRLMLLSYDKFSYCQKVVISVSKYMIGDDTLMLVYFYNDKHLSCIISVESSVAGRSVIDIGASAAQLNKLSNNCLQPVN